jgi:cysteine-rich repeat protein
MINVCGDGYVETATEGCDDANTLDSDGCSASCTIEGCGDGTQAGMEQCDDGNQVNDDTCTNLCRLTSCGDGVVQMDEACDWALQPDVCSMMCKRSAFYVFVTSTTLTGNAVVSLDSADAVCTQAAEGLAIAGTYKAWLSEGMTSARLFHSTVKYIRPDTATVADDWSDLTDGVLDAPINRDEFSAFVDPQPEPTYCDAIGADSAAVWTGTMQNGTTALDSCMDWSTASSQAFGQAGLLNEFDTDWSGCKFSCNTPARLYCIEQP